MIFKNPNDKPISTVSESAAAVDNALNHTEDQLKPNDTGFEGLTPEKLYGFNPDLGLTRFIRFSYKKSSYSYE